MFLTRLLPLFLVCWGCVEQNTPLQRHTIVRDSLGIGVVEALALSDLDTLSWRVDVGTSITIGVTDGEDAYLFADIAGVARLSDGRIVAADRGSDEVRFFDSTGHFLHAVGGRGDGPLEYRSITILRKVVGDSLVVVDRDGGRVTVLNAEGRQARRYSMATNVGQQLPNPAWGVFSDGTLLTMPYEGTDQIAPGVIEHRSSFRRLLEGTETVVSYSGAVHAMRMVNAAMAGPGAREGGPPRSGWAVGEELFLYAPGITRPEWWVYGEAGRLKRILRIHDPTPWAMSAETAVVGKFTADESGRLWIELNMTLGAGIEPIWIVWPPDQGPQYALRLPIVGTYRPASSAPVMEIGEDYVLIASLNEDRAPVVRLMNLRKQLP